MADTDQVVAEPVIASSHRALDVEPYVKRLFVEYPKLWAQVFPWEFPQNGTKEQEETFLRRFFDDREIRMQGGAGGDGNGFRFLKEVWYWAALWNLNHRLPAVVDWWFAQNDHKSLLQDPSLTQYFFSPDAAASTFFVTKEIDMYGEKFLGWAVKQIQLRLSADHRPAETEKQPVSNQSNVKTPADNAALETPTPTAQQPLSVSPAEAASPLANFAVSQVPVSKLSSSAMSPTVSTFTHPDENANPQTAQLRTFSVGSHPSFEPSQSFSNRRRGPQAGKRYSFSGNRHNQRSFGHKETRGVSGYLGSYEPPPSRFEQSMSKAMPVPGNLPPGWQYASPVEPMPPLPQGQRYHGPAQPHHMQSLPYAQQFQAEQLSMIPHSAYQPGSIPSGLSNDAYHNIQQPLIERCNGQAETRFYGVDQPSFNFEHAPHQQYQGRDSMNSRGHKSRGYHSMRGRGGRNRNSSSQSNEANLVMDPHFFRRPETNSTCGPANSFVQARGGGKHQQVWRELQRGENDAPRRIYQGGDARRYPSAQAVPDSYHGLPRAQQATIDISYGPTAAGFENTPSFKTPDRRNTGPLCQAGCSRTNVGVNCTTAQKVVIFGLPKDFPSEQLKQFLMDTYGNVLDIRSPFSVQHENISLTWVTFSDVSSVRKIMAQKENVWPGGPKLGVELAKEHFDIDHRARSMTGPTRYTASAESFVPASIATPSAISQRLPPQHQQFIAVTTSVPRAGDIDSRVGENAVSQLSGDAMSEDTTPIPSGQNTPSKKKVKSKKPKKKPRYHENVTSDESRSDGYATQSVDNVVPGHQTRQDSIVIDAKKAEQHPSAVTRDHYRRKSALSAHESPIESSVRNGATEEDANLMALKEVSVSDTVSSENPSTVAEATDDDDDVKAEKILEDAGVELATESEINANDIMSKPDDAPADETFYTASDSPGIEDEALLDKSDAKSISTSDELAVTVDAADAKTDAVVSDEKKPVKSATASGKFKNAPVPPIHILKTPAVSVTSPSAVTTPTSPIREDDKDKLQVNEQRTSSGSTDVPSSAFVTAPNTPLVPVPASGIKSKKTRKQKGPEQTESLSIFGKQQKKQKNNNNNKASSIRGKPKALAASNSQSNEAASRITSISAVAESQVDSDMKSNDKDVILEDTMDAQEDSTPITNPPGQFAEHKQSQPSSTDDGKVGSNQHENRMQDDAKPAGMISVGFPAQTNEESGLSRRPTLGQKVRSFFTKSQPVTEPTTSGSLPKEDVDVTSGLEIVADADQLAAASLLGDQSKEGEVMAQGDNENDHAIGLGISNHQIDSAAQSKKKGKAKKLKGKGKVETSGPLSIDGEKTTSFYSLAGNDVREDSSPAETASGSAGPSSPGRKIAVELAKSHSIIEARPSRRSHKRVVSNKDSANSASSAVETAVMLQGGPAANGEAHNVSIVTLPTDTVLCIIRKGDENSEEAPATQHDAKPRVIEDAAPRLSPEVEASRAMMERLAQKEALIKKEKAAAAAAAAAAGKTNAE